MGILSSPMLNAVRTSTNSKAACVGCRGAKMALILHEFLHMLNHSAPPDNGTDNSRGCARQKGGEGGESWEIYAVRA
jgi:hypothetical protein